MPHFILVWLRVGIAAVILAAVRRMGGLPLPRGWPVWRALIGIAALSTALAYVIFFRLLSTAGPTNLLLVTFLIPVSASLLAVVFLGEAISPRQFAGFALIALGLAAIDGRISLWK